jgi:hypothetical protein
MIIRICREKWPRLRHLLTQVDAKMNIGREQKFERGHEC